ncbi:MAG TPA: FtsX-like permease family protein, partial [Actinopolymorphaceae bacterium]
MTTMAIGLRLLRGSGKHGVIGSILTVAAVAVSTALLLAAVAANTGFAERAERDAWRNPQSLPAGQTETALQLKDVRQWRGQPVTVVDLAAVRDGDRPTPPGMPRFPAPGEVWVSPALADLLLDPGATKNAPAWLPTGAPTGTLTDDALIHGQELVLVTGRSPGAVAMDDAVSIADFDHGTPSNNTSTYQILTGVATVLTVVPLLVFGGAAARLTVARRDQRLAALRLVGATPAQVVAITVVEAVATAAIGAVLGALVYVAGIPGLARIELMGGTWHLGDLWIGPAWLLGIVLAVPLLVGLSAVAGLRRVVISPLGVARRQTPPGLRFARVVVFGGLVVAFLAFARTAMGHGSAGLVFLAVMGGLAFWGLNLVGPWVVALLGRIVAGLARTPATLLAGRRLTDDPKSAWRTVSGVALTGFVAGFVSLTNPGSIATSDPLARLLFTDIRTGTITVLVATFLVGMVSAGITAASSVLDRRQTYALLGLSGTPVDVLDAVRRRETLIPLAV